jgi:hypothetical protein
LIVQTTASPGITLTASVGVVEEPISGPAPRSPRHTMVVS